MGAHDSVVSLVCTFCALCCGRGGHGLHDRRPPLVGWGGWEPPQGGQTLPARERGLGRSTGRGGEKKKKKRDTLVVCHISVRNPFM